MDGEIQGYLTEFNILRGLLSAALKGIDDDFANRRPLPKDTNSIYGILAHLIGGQKHWVRGVINGESIQRDREAEINSSGRLSDILRVWEKTCADTDAALGKLTPEQLDEPRNISGHPEWGRITVRWCILHVISHLALHLGHIQLTRQVLEQQRS